MGNITDTDKRLTHRKDTFRDMCRNVVCSSKPLVREGNLINCLFLLILTFSHIIPALLQLKLINGDYLHPFISKSSMDQNIHRNYPPAFKPTSFPALLFCPGNQIDKSG